MDYLRKGKFISGMANCHVPGVYSIVFENRKNPVQGMLRMFYAATNILSPLEDDEDFIVMPHNHRQDLALYRICGNPYNVWMNFNGGNDRVQRYRFTSALLEDDFDLRWCGDILTADFYPDPIRKDGLFMAWDQVHTVVAPAGSAWAVEELELAPKWGEQFCFSRSWNKRLYKAGLYKNMSNEETAKLVEKIYGLCQKEG